jgi:hypothetical protein
MKVKVGKGTFSVKWVHSNPPLKIMIGESESIRRAGEHSSVECSIIAPNRDIVVGTAILHPKDMAAKLYDPDKGRKLALARALECLGVSKAARKRFWKAYFGE